MYRHNGHLYAHSWIQSRFSKTCSFKAVLPFNLHNIDTQTWHFRFRALQTVWILTASFHGDVVIYISTYQTKMRKMELENFAGCGWCERSGFLTVACFLSSWWCCDFILTANKISKIQTRKPRRLWPSRTFCIMFEQWYFLSSWCWYGFVSAITKIRNANQEIRKPVTAANVLHKTRFGHTSCLNG